MVLKRAEAVKLVHESHECGDDYDVCFIDWKMPDMDGAETARRIRSEVGPDTLIIIISAYDWGPIEAEARASGVMRSSPSRFSPPIYTTLSLQ